MHGNDVCVCVGARTHVCVYAHGRVRLCPRGCVFVCVKLFYYPNKFHLFEKPMEIYQTNIFQNPWNFYLKIHLPKPMETFPKNSSFKPMGFLPKNSSSKTHEIFI